MKFVWHNKNNLSSSKPITQVYGVCFDKLGNILIMRGPGKSWNIPGGTPRLNEKPDETLKRELREEVDVSIGCNKMVGYFEVISNKETTYQLRYAVVIDKIFPQTIDPDSGKINERKFIRPNEFFDYVQIDDYKEMLNEAINWYNSALNNNTK